MAFSRGAILPAALVLSVLAASGCSRSVRRPPEPAPAPSAPASGGRAEAAPVGRPATLDPSEEITPEELATIPDPVPGRAETPLQKGSGGGSGDDSIAPRAEPPDTLRSGVGGAIRAYVWRVQVYATQDRALADRKAKEAADRLGIASHIAWEGGQYKVRLGDFATEAEAQELRDRAVRSGYPGAFRVRVSSSS